LKSRTQKVKIYNQKNKYFFKKDSVL